MSRGERTEVGAVAALWRYPVKSMRGEDLDAAEVAERGLSGDRAFGLLDRADGKVASAKNPRKWPRLFSFQASFDESSGRGVGAASLRIALPDGRIATGDQDALDRILSEALGREVTLGAAWSAPAPGARPSVAPSWSGRAEEYWPDIEGLGHRDTVTDFALPAGTFFDAAAVHLVTTATLDRLSAVYPEGRLEVARFRPNVVVRVGGDAAGFVENGWGGRTLAIGDEVRLGITGPCGRCVMTTLAQGDLPRDAGILRAAVRHNQGQVGVYAAVVQGGTIRRGDRVRLGSA